MDNKTIRCHSLKYDGSLNYEWDLKIIEQTAEYILARGEVNRQLIHHKRGKTFTFENPNVEYFPLDGWFTVSVEKAKGDQLFYYCNISMPPKFSDNILRFVDLDLDLVRKPDEEWKLVDEDEFLENMHKMKYPEDLVAKAWEEVDKLFERINNNLFPFDGWITSYLDR